MMVLGAHVQRWFEPTSAGVKTKETANYRLVSVPGQSCHTCIFRIDNGASASTCKLVEGTVDADHVCDLFEPFEIDTTAPDAATRQENRGNPTAPQVCKYCDQPATHSIIWAEGIAYVPICDDHESDAIKSIGGQTEVDGMKTIVDDTKEIKSKVPVLGAVVKRWKGGYPQDLVDWYNAGADGAINWGEDGDFEACVAIAGKYIDNPEGFCNERHQDATGAPPGKAPGEGEDKSADPHVEERAATVNGKPSRSAAVAQRFLHPMIGAYQAKSKAQIAGVLAALYKASYVAGLRSTAALPGAVGETVTAGIQANEQLAPLLDLEDGADMDAITADNAPGFLATLLSNVDTSAGNILSYMNTDGAPDGTSQATSMTYSEAAAGSEAGAQDAAQAGGYGQMDPVPDDNACDVCEAAQSYDIGSPGPPWHNNCSCESTPSGDASSTDDDDSGSSDDTEATSALGRYVKRAAFTRVPDVTVESNSKACPDNYEPAIEDREVSAEAITKIESEIR